MTTALLATKFYAPPQPARAVRRPQLLTRLDAGLATRLTLVCAAAGFGKSTLISQWTQECAHPSAWLSLEAEDRDVTRFLDYVLGALQRVSPSLGAGLQDHLQGSHPATAATVLTLLVNQLSGLPGKLILVLDDYHLAASPAVDAALAFLLEHQPAQLHVVLLSRALPDLALGRLRVQGQLAEIGQEQLRFALEDATTFFQQGTLPDLSAAQVQALDARTEGWIAGLKLAALSLQGHPDPQAFITSFSGSHRFVQDYLLEEVLQQQPPEVQAFLLRSAVLDRLSADLCEAVLQTPGAQAMLERLEQANLFIVPLDADKRWYRYHHLFAELLRQRLRKHEPAAPLHLRASQWYADQGLEAEAFLQATAAQHIPTVLRLIEGRDMPLYLRGEAALVLRWLSGQTPAVLDAHPGLWIVAAWCLLVGGQHSQIEARLHGAEAALRLAGPHASPADAQGQLAVLWAWLSVSQNKVEAIVSHAQRALDLLPASSGAARTAAHCALGVAHLFAGQRAAARQAFEAVVEASRSGGNRLFTVIASIALAGLQVGDFQLHLAAASYRAVIALVANPADPVGYEAQLGLARLLYEWNDLDGAAMHASLGSQLSARAESETGLGAELLNVRLLVLRGDSAQAQALLSRIGEAARTRRFKGRMQEFAELQVLQWLRQGHLEQAAALADEQALPLGQARVLLARGQGAEALRRVQLQLREAQAHGLAYDALKALVLQALIQHALGDNHQAQQSLQQALVQGAAQSAIRLLADEGAPLQVLLHQTPCPAGLVPYVAQLKQAFGTDAQEPGASGAGRLVASQTAGRMDAATSGQPLDAFSERELEVLRLIQQGHSNQKIGERLFLSLSTVKWHNQNIFSKLDVQRRTQAVARALELKLL